MNRIIRRVVVAILLLASASAGSTAANDLSKTTSAYLRSAAGQPVDWLPWGEEAFALARRKDRPILLDVGAVWCHTCHLMDRENYENPRIAEFINRNFVAIRVDRDERPDLDRRYQIAVQALGKTEGWPLTAFLTPAGEVFFGGNFFPAEDGPHGPGFRSVLQSVADLYHGQKSAISARVLEAGKSLAGASSSPRRSRRGFSAATLTALRQQTLAEFDSDNGGFRQAEGPKFPDPGAIEFLLALSWEDRDPAALHAALRTLDRMADGGIHDRLGGGFHRYTRDSAWRSPHFEKTAPEQAALLQNYLHAYQLTQNPKYRNVAEGILNYVLGTLSSPAGGFWASQDADVSPYDDGSYYTWNREDLERVLTREEFVVVAARYGIEKSEKQALAVLRDWNEIGRKSSISPQRAEELGERGLEKMRAGRARRKAPAVDRTLFANNNGMLITALLDAWRILGRDDAKERALDSYDLVVSRLRGKDGFFGHSDTQNRTASERFLTDQVWMAHAATDVFVARGDPADLEIGRALMEKVWRTFRDRRHGGFFDLPARSASRHPYLSRQVKPIEDVPEPSSNSIAILTLQRLATIRGDPVARERATVSLDAFVLEAPPLGAIAGSYGLAGFVELHPGAHVVILGDRGDPQITVLLQAVNSAFRPGLIATVHGLEDADRAFVPSSVPTEALRPGEKPIAFVCVRGKCAPPTGERVRLAELVRSFH
jgi:uncharacterized protein